MLMVYLEMSSLFFFLSGVVRWRGRPVRAGVGSGAGLSGGVVRRCPVLGAGFRGVLRCALVWLRRTWGKLGGVYLGELVVFGQCWRYRGRGRCVGVGAGLAGPGLVAVRSLGAGSGWWSWSLLQNRSGAVRPVAAMFFFCVLNSCGASCILHGCGRLCSGRSNFKREGWS